jgi:hypothetical protein
MHHKNENMSDDQIINQLNDIIKINKINYILIFLLPLNNTFFITLKNKLSEVTHISDDVLKIDANGNIQSNDLNAIDAKIIFYNFDDPYSNNLDMIKYSKGIDYFFTPLKSSSIELKILFGDDVKNVIQLNSYTNTFDNDYFVRLNDKKKTYDICILLDDEFNKYYDSRKIILNIKLMANDAGYEVKLLGSSHLQSIYTDIYEGTFCNENDNILECVSDSNVIIYLKNNTFGKNKIDMMLLKLLQYGNIVMTPYIENLNTILRDDYNCMIFDVSTYIHKLNYCILNYDSHKIIKKNAKKIIDSEFHIDTWTSNIIKHITSNTNK